MKKLSVLLSAVMLTLSINVVSLASGGDESDVADRVAEDTQPLNESSNMVYFRTLERGVYLSYGLAKISDFGDGVAGVHAATVNKRTAEKIGVTAYLERLEGGAWNYVTSYTATEYNNYYVDISRSKNVSKGYYYRTSTSHIAVNGGTTETVSTNSGALWIG